MARTKQQQERALDQTYDRATELWAAGSLRTVFNNYPDAIFLIDGGRIVDCNHSAVKMFRAASRTEVLSWSALDLSSSSHLTGSSFNAKMNEMIEIAFEFGSHRFEWRAKRSDNSEFPAEVLLTALSFTDGQVLHAVWRDITRRKDAERRVMKEDAFRAGQSRVLEMIARGDKLPEVLASLVTLIEQQSEDMLCSVLQLSEDGQHIRHGAAPSLPEIYVQAVNGAPIGPKNGSCGTAMYLGKQVIVTDMLEDPLWEDYRELAKLSGLRACWSTPIISGSGKVLGSFAMYYREPRTPKGDEARLTEVATHIAGIAIEHERAGNELRASEEQVSLLQAITMEIVLAADLNAALEVVLRRVCQTTGWVLGQSWIPRADGSALECSPAWFASGKHVEGFRLSSESTRLHPGIGLPGRVWRSKQPVWIRDVAVDSNFPRAEHAREAGLKAAFAIPIIAHDEVIAVIEFFMTEQRSEDERLVKLVTAVAAQLDLAIERKRAEEQVRLTQAELAHVGRVTTMGELAASIAHEVNQPLGAIVGNADICLRWLDEAEPNLAELREALEDIANDGRRASQVISRVRSLAKKHVPEKSPLNLSDVAREVVELVSHEAQRKQVAISSDFAVSLPLVPGDRVQLQQVLLNLVMNGIEAMNEVDKNSRALTLKTDLCEWGVLALVCDCGVGIDPSKVDQIFKPFHTTKSGGMGMGLAISKSIIESHGGKLWAEPNEQGGATFKFTLPVSTT